MTGGGVMVSKEGGSWWWCFTFYMGWNIVDESRIVRWRFFLDR